MVFLQAPCDNGSKIQNYILQWDEVFFLFHMKEMCIDVLNAVEILVTFFKTKTFVL